MNLWWRKSQNHGCLRGRGRVSTVKGHAENTWSDGNILYHAGDLGYTGVGM